ncbi:MAG TPA: molybdopterin-dependent oxidoreductase [Gemmatimonadaceae bacterium]|jgi:DMSO/TMAO reductase YedYZ molybdopterin-dependent catalytic subunit
MSERSRSDSRIDRRGFLTIAGAGAAAALIGCDSFGSRHFEPALAAAQRGNERVERLLFRHRSEDRIPGGARLSGNAFPQYFVSDEVPIWDEATRGIWRLEVSGAVRRPLSLSLDDLTKLPRVAQSVDHFCVEGWTARAQWIGVRVSELAKLAGITNDAHYADFQSFDSDYHESWDMDSAMHHQTLIAYAMDGHYLGPGHGAPARLHSPVKLGYKNTKYLTRVVFMPARNGGYWSDRGYEWYGGT